MPPLGQPDRRGEHAQGEEGDPRRLCGDARRLAGAAVAGIAIIKPYAVGIDGDYYTKRLLSVGDTVPETSNPAKQFQMIGIPDGLGAHKSGTSGSST